MKTETLTAFAPARLKSAIALSFIAMGAVSALAPAQTEASEQLTMGDYMTSRITTANRAFEQACSELRATSLASDPMAEDPIEFKQFFLGIAPKVSFGLSGVLDLEISPEITFIWEKVDAD